jgi:hypothetical protein
VRTGLCCRRRDVQTVRDFGHRQALYVVQDDSGPAALRALKSGRSEARSARPGPSRSVAQFNDWIRIAPIVVERRKDLVERDLVTTGAAAAPLAGGVGRDSVDAIPARRPPERVDPILRTTLQNASRAAS